MVSATVENETLRTVISGTAGGIASILAVIGSTRSARCRAGRRRARTAATGARARPVSARVTLKTRWRAWASARGPGL